MQHRIVVYFRRKAVDFILCINDNHVIGTQPFRTMGRQKLELDFVPVFYRINLPRFLVVVELFGIAEIPRVEPIATNQQDGCDSGFSFGRIILQYFFDSFVYSDSQIMVFAAFRPLF